MSEPIRVAVLGFTAFERNGLASYFTLAARRTPCYDIVLDIDEARFIVADADHRGVAELLRELGRTGDAIFIGALGPAEAALTMPRPFDPMLVMRELDRLLAQRSPAPAAPAAVPESAPRSRLQPPPQAIAPAPAPTRPAAPAPLPDATPSAGVASAWPVLDALASDVAGRRDAAQARKRLREAALRPTPLRRALLVDDSEIALHFLDRLLAPYGMDTDYAYESDRALELLSHQNYGFVFLDVDLGAASRLDGLALCQHVRRQSLAPGGLMPQVIIVSAFNDPVDQVRATLAGADAFLGKPLDIALLDRLLQRHGLNRQAADPGIPLAAAPHKPR
jgi:CheY-like chemotaxis protein